MINESYGHRFHPFGKNHTVRDGMSHLSLFFPLLLPTHSFPFHIFLVD